jgi:hypothetical protein
MMSDAVVISLIAAGSGLLSALVGLANNVMARKNDAQNARIEAHLQEAKTTAAVIVKQTNGMSQQLATVTGQKEFARGQHQGEVLVQNAVHVAFNEGVEQGHKDVEEK